VEIGDPKEHSVYEKLQEASQEMGTVNGREKESFDQPNDNFRNVNFNNLLEGGQEELKSYRLLVEVKHCDHYGRSVNYFEMQRATDS
jgi:hypothetical protein